MKEILLLILIFIVSCGRESGLRDELLSLHTYTSQSYELSYQRNNSPYDFTGTVQIEGAGFHIKIQSTHLKSGFLYLALHSAPHCHDQLSDYQVMWYMNNNLYQNLKFSHGFDLQKGRIKESFDYYLLKRFLHRQKKGFYSLPVGEGLSLDQRTLLFYYSHSNIIDSKNLVLLGCAEFHST